MVNTAAKLHQNEAQSNGEHACGNNHARLIFVRKLLSYWGNHQRRQRIGQERQSSGDAAITQRPLEKNRQINHEWPEAEIHPHRSKKCAGKIANPEDRKIKHRARILLLHDKKDDEAHRRSNNDADGGSAGKAKVRPLRNEVR